MHENGKITANPYQVGGKVRDLNQFIGRDREVRDILSLVATMQSVSVIGERRIGKSSLLLYLKENGRRLLDDETIEFFYLDFQEPINSPDEFYLRACELMSSDPSKASDDSSAQDKFDTAVDGRKVVWCLDEFEQTIEEDFNADFFKHLRHLAQSGNLSLIVATQTPLDELYQLKQDMTSGFPNVFSVLRLGELTEEDAYELVARPRNGHRFTETEIREILKIAGQHPYWLSYACSQAYAAGDRLDFAEIEKTIKRARYGAAQPHKPVSEQTEQTPDSFRSNLQSESSSATVAANRAERAIRISVALSLVAGIMMFFATRDPNPISLILSGGVLLVSLGFLIATRMLWPKETRGGEQ